MKRLQCASSILFLLILVAGNFINISAQSARDLNDYNEPASRLRGVIEKYAADFGSLNRFYTARESGSFLSSCINFSPLFIFI